MLSVPTPLIPCLVVTCAWHWLFNVEATKHLYDVWAQWPLNYFIQGWNSSYQPTQMLRMDCFMWYYFHQSHIWCSPLIFLINYPKGSRISIDGPTYRLSESNTTLMGKLVWVSRLSRCPVSLCYQQNRWCNNSIVTGFGFKKQNCSTFMNKPVITQAQQLLCHRTGFTRFMHGVRYRWVVGQKH